MGRRRPPAVAQGGSDPGAETTGRAELGKATQRERDKGREREKGGGEECSRPRSRLASSRAQRRHAPRARRGHSETKKGQHSKKQGREREREREKERERRRFLFFNHPFSPPLSPSFPPSFSPKRGRWLLHGVVQRTGARRGETGPARKAEERALSSVCVGGHWASLSLPLLLPTHPQPSLSPRSGAPYR